AYSIMSRIACLSRWRARFRSEAAHALPPASSASFARDRFWTSFGPKAPRLEAVVTRASSAMSRQSIEANVAAAGSRPPAPPGRVVVVVGAWVVVVELNVVAVVAVVDVVVVVLEAVVGVAHCERSTAQPAQRAQSGASAGIAVAASHTATDRPPTIGHSQL